MKLTSVEPIERSQLISGVGTDEVPADGLGPSRLNAVLAAYIGSGLGMRETVRRLCDRGRHARSEGNLDEAYRAFAEAVTASRDAGLDQELIDALKGCAQIERDRHRAASAVPLYEEAVSLARKLGHPRILAHTIRHLGEVQCEMSSLARSEACYEEALGLYRGATDTPALELANAVRPLALLRERTGQVEEAKRLWLEARQLYAYADVAEGVHEADRHLSELER